ncbi:Hypothetical protein PHPALM_5174, partial [Phytophthora palmivora]
MTARGFLQKVTTRYVARTDFSAYSQSIGRRAAGSEALGRLESQQYKGRTSAVPALGMAAVALAVAASATYDDAETHAEAKQLIGGGLGTAVVDTEGEETNTRPRGGRRLLLKQRSKHQAKLQEVDQMKTHLVEYKQRREAIDSLRARFDMYASKSVEAGDGRRVKVMTFTDFL